MSARRSEGGYVMLLVAVTVALLAIGLLTAARVQGGLARSLRTLREDVAQETAAQSAAARVAFLLLTEPLGPRAIVVGGARDGDGGRGGDAGRFHAATGLRLSEVHLDGRPYATGDGMWVGVQDEAGLFNLNAGDDAALAALIEGTGVSRLTARRLAASLNDYVDEDALVRPSGAEADAYARARLSPPANRRLSAPWEAARAFGWRASLSDGDRASILRLASAPPDGRALNVNTAPSAVLQAVLGDTRMARNLIARREQSPLKNLDEMEGLTGVQTRADGLVLAVQPGSAFRIVVAFGRSAEAARRGFEGQVVFAANGADRPIYWRSVRRVQSPDGMWDGRDHGDRSESLPASAALPAS